MNAEDFLISLFAKHSLKIGDDGAIIDSLVYSKDIFFENVHFKRSWMSLEQIAYRSMMVNLSDAIAMNAKPKYVLLGVAMPSDILPEEINDFHKGFLRAAEEFDVKIIGGDTIANTKLDISITVISQTSNPLTRKGLKEGHLIAYTGKLGQSRKELRYLLAGGKIHRQSKFVTFNLRARFVSTATKSLSAGMDISDGLNSDVHKLTKANRIGCSFFRPVNKHFLCSGEEYEMLVGFSPRNRKKIHRIAQHTRTPLTIFSKAVRGKFINRCKANHFK